MNHQKSTIRLAKWQRHRTLQSLQQIIPFPVPLHLQTSKSNLDYYHPTLPLYKATLLPFHIHQNHFLIGLSTIPLILLYPFSITQNQSTVHRNHVISTAKGQHPPLINNTHILYQYPPEFFLAISSNQLDFLDMGKRNNDPTVVNSSIALLQERFKQLERVKVMKEERELLRGVTTATEAERPNWFLHTELVRPTRPLLGPTPSFQLDTSNCYGRPEFQALETSLSMGFRHGSDTADVDTSLHL